MAIAAWTIDSITTRFAGAQGSWFRTRSLAATIQLAFQKTNILLVVQATINGKYLWQGCNLKEYWKLIYMCMQKYMEYFITLTLWLVGENFLQFSQNACIFFSELSERFKIFPKSKCCSLSLIWIGYDKLQANKMFSFDFYKTRWDSIRIIYNMLCIYQPLLGT